jgi:hypothetical protein
LRNVSIGKTLLYYFEGETDIQGLLENIFGQAKPLRWLL